MNEERIALEFITVYRKYKEKSFRRRNMKSAKEAGLLAKKDAERGGRLNKINK